jgi:hypothetical protein
MAAKRRVTRSAAIPNDCFQKMRRFKVYACLKGESIGPDFWIGLGVHL